METDPKSTRTFRTNKGIIEPEGLNRNGVEYKFFESAFRAISTYLQPEYSHLLKDFENVLKAEETRLARRNGSKRRSLCISWQNVRPEWNGPARSGYDSMISDLP